MCRCGHCYREPYTCVVPRASGQQTTALHPGLHKRIRVTPQAVIGKVHRESRSSSLSSATTVPASYTAQAFKQQLSGLPSSTSPLPTRRRLVTRTSTKSRLRRLQQALPSASFTATPQRSPHCHQRRRGKRTQKTQKAGVRTTKTRQPGPPSLAAGSLSWSESGRVAQSDSELSSRDHDLDLLMPVSIMLGPLLFLLARTACASGTYRGSLRALSVRRGARRRVNSSLAQLQRQQRTSDSFGPPLISPDICSAAWRRERRPAMAQALRLRDGMVWTSKGVGTLYVCLFPSED